MSHTARKIVAPKDPVQGPCQGCLIRLGVYFRFSLANDLFDTKQILGSPSQFPTDITQTTLPALRSNTQRILASPLIIYKYCFHYGETNTLRSYQTPHFNASARREDCDHADHFPSIGRLTDRRASLRIQGSFLPICKSFTTDNPAQKAYVCLFRTKMEMVSQLPQHTRHFQFYSS